MREPSRPTQNRCLLHCIRVQLLDDVGASFFGSVGGKEVPDCTDLAGDTQPAIHEGPQSPGKFLKPALSAGAGSRAPLKKIFPGGAGIDEASQYVTVAEAVP